MGGIGDLISFWGEERVREAESVTKVFLSFFFFLPCRNRNVFSL
jgi:hypothetical protein